RRTSAMVPTPVSVRAGSLARPAAAPGAAAGVGCREQEKAPMTRMLARIARFTGRILVRFARILLLLAIVAAACAAAGYHWLDKQILSSLPADLSSFREYRPP